MCGRYTLRARLNRILQEFDVPALDLFDAPPRYNIAPTQQVPVVRLIDGQRQLAMLRWGLVPAWSNELPKIPLINARAETVADKPSFRSAFKQRRCLMIADGFYEWPQVGPKQAYYIQRRDAGLIAFAGLYERCVLPTGTIESCTLITTTPNSLMATFHDRMPVILSPAQFPLWLDPEFASTPNLLDLLRPLPDDALQAHRVGPQVNSPRFNEPACIEPV